MLDKFAKKEGVEVSLDTYGSNEEMLAKIQAGASGYDLVWPSVHMNDIMLQLGLLQETGVDQMPGFENIDPAFLRTQNDPNAAYCLPYAWGTVGIFYNKQYIPAMASWREFFDYAAANPGKVTMLDDMREVLGVGLIMNGFSVNIGARELLPDNMKNNPNINPPPETMERLQIFVDLGNDLKLYDRAWTRIKTN